MTVAEPTPKGHVSVMNTRDDNPERQPGVQKTTPSWTVAPDPLFARPVKDPDWDAIIDKIERDFPKTLARLAE